MEQTNNTCDDNLVSSILNLDLVRQQLKNCQEKIDLCQRQLKEWDHDHKSIDEQTVTYAKHSLDGLNATDRAIAKITQDKFRRKSQRQLINNSRRGEILLEERNRIENDLKTNLQLQSSLQSSYQSKLDWFKITYPNMFHQYENYVATLKAVTI